MRADMVPGATFPDYELPDLTRTPRRLSELQGDDPLILTTSTAASSSSRPEGAGSTREGRGRMEDNTLIESRFTATINAPIEPLITRVK